MNVPDALKRISERLHSSATVTNVFGEPVLAEGRTIVPVARVRYGFGAGGSTMQAHLDAGDGEPAGETRFISFEDRKRVIRA